MPRKHVVAAGQCLESIAFSYGIFPDRVWDYPDNASLREQRNPHVLMPGDVLVIPDFEQRWLPVALNQRHTFKRRGVPARLHIDLEHDGKPRAGVPYVLEVGGKKIEGKTDAQGGVEAWIPPDADVAVLRISKHEVYEVELGGLTPASDDDGALARLRNLGYPFDEDDEDSIEAAVLRFQRAEKLSRTGLLDDATAARLLERHGS